MAKLFGGKKSFDTKGKKEMDEYTPLPDDDYLFKITESAWKPTSKKTGHYASLKLTVVEGVKTGTTHKDRTLYRNLNLDNPNEQTVEIAEKEMTSICKACGRTGVDDTEELHGILFWGRVRQQKGRGDNPDGNKVTKYWADESGSIPKKDKKTIKSGLKKKKKPKVSFGDD